MADLLAEVAAELARAREKHPRPFNSSHEGYGILLEEVDELWDEVKAQTSERRYNAIRKEALQVAAMCLRLIEDVCDRRSAGGVGVTTAGRLDAEATDLGRPAPAPVPPLGGRVP